MQLRNRPFKTRRCDKEADLECYKTMGQLLCDIWTGLPVGKDTSATPSDITEARSSRLKDVFEKWLFINQPENSGAGGGTQVDTAYCGISFEVKGYLRQCVKLILCFSYNA